MKVKRTERIWLKPSDELSRLCHLSKNLYNEANYIVRQELFNSGKWIRYNELCSLLKPSENYRALPAQSAQQTLKYLDHNWKAFFKAVKAWKAHPEKFYAKPGIPKYKNKDGEFVLIFTNQQCKIVDGLLIFPNKVTEVIGKIKTRIREGLREVRIVPKGMGHVLEIVYEKDIDVPKRDKSRVAGIDLGVRNLVAMANNIGKKPIVVKGGTVKSINQYFNRENARVQSTYDRQGIKTGKRAKRLIVKREKKLHDYFHKVSRAIIDYLVDNDIGTLVIGYNDNWKQGVNIGKRNNQTFVTIPFYKLVHMLQYKAEEQGIEVIIQDEAHTSKCSFFDNEPVEHREPYIGKRISRGLFRTGKVYIVNADVNAGNNIIKKAVPKAFTKAMADGIEGAVGHPLRLVIRASL